MPNPTDWEPAQLSIPVMIRDGQVCFYFDGPLPKLREGTVGQLVVQGTSVLDDDMRRRLLEERTVPLLPGGSTLYVRLNSGTFDRAADIPAGLEAIPCGYPGVFARVILHSALMLSLRGTNQPRLTPVSCSIPALAAEAKSLNHACTLLSQAYEKKRISHTYNVFTNVFYHDEAQGRLFPLDRLRRTREVLFDERFNVPSGDADTPEADG